MGEEENENETVENIVAFAIFFLVVFLVIGFWNQWWGWFGTESPNPTVSTQIGDAPVKGEPDAPVTVVEYSDFECPYCKNFYEQTLPPLLERYVNAGTVRIAYKHFPLPMHDNAQSAAVASECAKRQDAFWEYHDKLFDNQNQLGRENYVNWADDLGLNTSDFRECLDDETVSEQVRQDMEEGRQIGVTGTPSFVVGATARPLQGELLIGSQDIVTIEAAIQRALNS